jgi:hypothetical protein
MTKNQSIVDKDLIQLISWRMFLLLVCTPIIMCVLLILPLPAGTLKERRDKVEVTVTWFIDDIPVQVQVFIALIATAIAIVVIMFLSQRLYAAVTLVLLMIFWTIITFNHLRFPSGLDPIVVTTALVMVWVMPIILLLVAPAKAVSRRLIFLANRSDLANCSQRTLETCAQTP